MTTLAALSDIHGNERALDAVLVDIESRGINDIVNLGDCAYGPFNPTAVLNTLIDRRIRTVSGNDDRILVETARGMPHSRTATFCAQRLNRSHVEWLANLPLTMYVHEGFLFHGLPEDDTRYLLTAVEESTIRQRDPREVEQLLATHRHSLILCGHDHTPRVVILETGNRVINPGSVGCPAYTDDNPREHVVENGSPHARYAIVDTSDNSACAELVTVVYDWDAAAEEAAANGFPDWAVWLRTGRT